MTPSNPAPVGDEREREAFERDAEPMGFDLTRHYCAAPEPWSQYKDIDTGNRWGGWLARASHEAKGWMPIASAPVGREIFVARAFDVSNGFTGGKPYTTDPWCVWQDEPGKYARWPHNFPPTHFMPLPAAPSFHDGEDQCGS